MELQLGLSMKELGEEGLRLSWTGLGPSLPVQTGISTFTPFSERMLIVLQFSPKQYEENFAPGFLNLSIRF